MEIEYPGGLSAPSSASGAGFTDGALASSKESAGVLSGSEITSGEEESEVPRETSDAWPCGATALWGTNMLWETRMREEEAAREAHTSNPTARKGRLRCRRQMTEVLVPLVAIKALNPCHHTAERSHKEEKSRHGRG